MPFWFSKRTSPVCFTNRGAERPDLTWTSIRRARAEIVSPTNTGMKCSHLPPAKIHWMPGRPGATMPVSTVYRKVGGAITRVQRVRLAYSVSHQSGLSSPTL